MVLLKVLLSLFLFAQPVSWGSTQNKLVKMSTSTIKFDRFKLNVWIADTNQKRAQGMMFKTQWPSNIQGMLFIFDKQNRRSFWMKNTFLPLSLGFFNSEGELVEIASLNPPKSLAQVKVDRVLSRKPAKYVLELPKGWFEKQKVQLGAKLQVL